MEETVCFLAVEQTNKTLLGTLAGQIAEAVVTLFQDFHNVTCHFHLAWLEASLMRLQ